MSVTPTHQSAESHYIFSDESAFEQERLKRLNELYNPNTISIVTTSLKPACRVLEIGPGTGEIGSWIAEQVGQKQYTALDISAENIAILRKKIPAGTHVTGSLTDIDTLEEFRGKKFDVIFIRWVLAYIPKEQVEATIKILFEKFLNENGSLVCEECSVYKVHCIQNASQERLDVEAYNNWLRLTRAVQALEGVHADFELGSTIKQCFAHLNAQISVHKFQPIMDTQYTKDIPVLAMKAAKTFLVSKKVRNEEELDLLTDSLAKVAINPSISVKYLKNTAIVATKVH